MTEVAIEEADVQLQRLVREARAGGEVVITLGHQPVARLVAVGSDKPTATPKRQPGSGLILHIAEDFDAPLDDFRDYM